MTGRIRVVAIASLVVSPVLLVAAIAATMVAIVATPLHAAPPARATTRPAGFKFVTVTTVLDESGLPKKMHRRETFFIGDNAFVVDAEGLPDTVLDLRKQTAANEQGPRWSLADLQQRFEQERASSRQRAELAKDPDTAQALKYQLDPAFAVTEDKGLVVATNPVVRYEIDCGAVDPQYQKRLYLAMRLETYAAASATAPPFVELALIDELERRGSIAQDAKAISKVGGKQAETRIQSRLLPLSDEDQKRLATLLLPAGGL
jgi:hypothetical protein